MRITVVGLGKIGLPLAVQCATKGHSVWGADISAGVVAMAESGEPPFPGEADLDYRLADVRRSGQLRVTTDTASAVADSDAVIVVVPLLVDKQGTPDFASLDAATDSIARGLRHGTLVSYETTLPVGTTRTRLAPRLALGSELTLGEDLFVAFSPERVSSGRVFGDLARYPKLIGGIDEASAHRCRALYEAILDFDPRPDLPRTNGVWNLGSSEAAELAKLAETTYRDVNIGLANQFAIYADRAGVNITAVIDACNSQPYSHIHQPGIAVGGHCIPVYPRFYLWNDPDATIVRAAREANEGMPEYGVSLLDNALGGLMGRRVAVLGAAYRAGVKETAFSGVFPIVDALVRRGAQVWVHDPMFDDCEIRSLGFNPYSLGAVVDGAVVHTGHDIYRSVGPESLPGVRAIVDGRAMLDPRRWDNVDVVLLGSR